MTAWVRFIAIAAVLLFQASGEEFEVVPRSVSPDGSIALATAAKPRGRGIVFFDTVRKVPISNDLSTEPVLNVIGLAQVPDQACRYEVVWTPDSKRVAVWAGCHQFSDVAAYHMGTGEPAKLVFPELRAHRLEIERSVRPFQISKSWSDSPSWDGANRLSYQMSGEAFRDAGEREDDFLSFAFLVTIEFNNKDAKAKVVGFRRVK